jgi:hypothetical protein
MQVANETDRVYRETCIATITIVPIELPRNMESSLQLRRSKR